MAMFSDEGSCAEPITPPKPHWHLSSTEWANRGKANIAGTAGATCGVPLGWVAPWENPKMMKVEEELWMRNHARDRIPQQGNPFHDIRGKEILSFSPFDTLLPMHALAFAAQGS